MLIGAMNTARGVRSDHIGIARKLSITMAKNTIAVVAKIAIVFIRQIRLQMATSDAAGSTNVDEKTGITAMKETRSGGGKAGANENEATMIRLPRLEVTELLPVTDTETLRERIESKYLQTAIH